MNRIFPFVLITAYFFVFLIPEANSYYIAWDRKIPQFMILSLLNIISFAYLFKLGLVFNTLKNIITEKTVICYAGFLIICFISILFAKNTNESIVVTIQYLTYLICFISIYSLANLSSNTFIKFFIILVSVSVFIESWAVVYNAIDLVWIQNSDFTRDNFLLRGFAGNININANSIAIKLLVVYYMLYKSKKRHFLIFSLITITLAYTALFILLSRTAFLSIFLTTIMFLVWMGKTYLRKSLMIILLMAISFLFVQTSLNSQNSNEITDRISSITYNDEDDSVNQRLRYYSHAFKSISVNPIFGIGIGNWKLKSIDYDSKDIDGYTVPYHAHNDFLQIAAEIGIIGFIFYLLIFLIPIFNLIKKILKRNLSDFELIIFLMITSYLIDSSLNFPIARPISHLFIIFTLVTYIILHNNNQLDEVV